MLDSLPRPADLVVVDQTPIKGTRRSKPATYSGVQDAIRDALANANKVKSASFSANSEGACPTCIGLGVTYTDLAYMPAWPRSARGARVAGSPPRC